ncbi:MAG: response regulator [Phycisphaerae bacterium]|nr:response regulator [Phycisphaerae bacterium]
MPASTERQRISRLLIVEDDQTQLRTLTAIMEGEGFEVVGCTTASAALEQADRGDIEVAVLDLRLPDLHGTQLLEKLRARGSRINIVINTAFATFDTAKEAVNLGAFAYVQKAGDPEELVRHVHRAFRAQLERYNQDLESAVATRTRELREANEALWEEIFARRAIEETLKKALHDLDEQVKELTCMYEAAQCMRKHQTLEKVFLDVATLIPSAWQYPEITRAKVRLEGKEFVPEPFEETQWKLTADILTGGERCGSVEVYYLQQRPDQDEGPFLNKERRFINEIAHALGEAVQRKQAEESLREQENLLRSIIDGIDDAVFVKDLEGHYLLVNSAVARRFGKTPGEITGLTDGDLWAPEVAERIAVRDREVIGSATSRSYEQDFEYPNGEKRTYSLAKHPRRTADGTVGGVIGIARDITERKQSQERVRQHQEELAHVSRLSTIGEMTAGIAHGLNQPLFAVLTYAEACRLAVKSGRRTPDELLSDLERISAAAEEAGEVVRRLRNFVRKREPSRSTVDLNKLIQSVVPFIEDDLTKNDTRLRLELDPRIPTVLADSLLLQQVVLNLTRNAIEAMMCHDDGERGLLIQTSVPESDIVEVAVCDTGPGLAAEHMDRLFDPFFTTKSHGLGLGLSLSRSLIEAEDGHLTAERNPDHGMTFRFTLPVCAGDPDDGV